MINYTTRFHLILQVYMVNSFIQLHVFYFQMQLYGSKSFARYNMFNHHFFDGDASVNSLTEFMTGCPHDSVAMVFDPPFGGMVEALSVSIRKLSDLWKTATQGLLYSFKMLFSAEILLKHEDSVIWILDWWIWCRDMLVILM